MLPMDILIEVLGWGYFAAWSASFYGQLILNHKLKNVEGMNLSYLYLNITGFIFYSIYCLYGYFNKNSPEIGNVNLHDLLFSVHALMMCLCQYAQTLIYPRGKNRVHPTIKTILITVCSISATYALFTKVFNLYTPPHNLSIFNIFGYLKLMNTFVKYLPQMLWNFQRRSTSGFSICGVMMDFTGGNLLLVQMALEHFYYNYHLNPIKILLAIISILYNVIFLVQRYCLYPEPSNFQRVRDEISMEKEEVCDKHSV